VLAAALAPLLAAACTSDPAGAPGPAQASEVTACGSLSDWGKRCAAETQAESCNAKLVDGCNDLASALNASALSDAMGCMARASCADGATKCLAESLPRARPTAAHQALADAFCSQCAPTAGDACRDGAANDLLAKLALPFSDALVDEIRERCASGPACGATFSACAQGVAAKGLAKRLSTATAQCFAQSILSPVTPPSDQPPAAGGGAPGPTCTPRTCRDVGADCGVHDDGCGGSLGCGVCAGGPACATDSNEPNDARAKATNLGTFTDSPVGQATIRGLTMPDGDEDWYTFKVQDKGYLGNPKISVSAKLTSLEVSAYFLCNNQSDESACELGAADNTLGRGCKGAGSVKIHASCGWTIYDEGTVVVRVRKRAADAACTTYDLSVAVGE
jgi:hypothetical protein